MRVHATDLKVCEMCTAEKLVLPDSSLGNLYLRLEVIIIAVFDF
jgi:hypothetical protein